MRRSPLLFAFLLSSAAVLLPQSSDDAAERGRYLVEEVAKCQDCHTPMTENGPDLTKWMKGTVLGFAPINPVPKWHKTSPDITPGGRLWQRWGEQGLVKFMETGAGPTGGHADPPMPTYKMKPEDAAAVVAYLKTLK